MKMSKIYFDNRSWLSVKMFFEVQSEFSFQSTDKKVVTGGTYY